MRMLRMTTRRLMIGIAAAAVILGAVLSSRRFTETHVAVLEEGHDHATRGEQLAEFPVTPLHHPWHGYPLWPLNRHEEAGRKARPSIEALEKMVVAAVLSKKQKSRLAGGKTI
jgi:hypothetical protein